MASKIKSQQKILRLFSSHQAKNLLSKFYISQHSKNETKTKTDHCFSSSSLASSKMASKENGVNKYPSPKNVDLKFK